MVIFDKSGIWCGAGFGAGYRLSDLEDITNPVYKSSLSVFDKRANTSQS